MPTTTRCLLTALAFGFVSTGSAPAQAFYYIPAPHVARVVDARPQRASLGLVMDGSTPLAATFREGAASALQTFFTT